jgi:hypothetical protein
MNRLGYRGRIMMSTNCEDDAQGMRRNIRDKRCIELAILRLLIFYIRLCVQKRVCKSVCIVNVVPQPMMLMVLMATINQPQSLPLATAAMP